MNFQKNVGDKQIKIYPSRLKKYLNNSQIVCVYDSQLLVGYMIIETMENDLIWIKQIVIASEYREFGLATQLVKTIIEYKFIGIITNNPIMIKILKSLGYKINCEKDIYVNLNKNLKIKNMIDLYNIEQIIVRDTSYWALTHLINTQKIMKNIDYSPLHTIKDGYEWFVLFEKDN